MLFIKKYFKKEKNEKTKKMKKLKKEKIENEQNVLTDRFFVYIINLTYER